MVTARGLAMERVPGADSVVDALKVRGTLLRRSENDEETEFTVGSPDCDVFDTHLCVGFDTRVAMDETFLMLDVETLGPLPDGLMVQLAAVQFDRKGHILQQFHQYIEPNSRYGTVDPSTLGWWLQQDGVAHVLANKYQVATPVALSSFNSWLVTMTKAPWPSSSWAWGSWFDSGILAHAYTSCDTKNPFLTIRCASTVAKMAGVELEEPAHDALADCLRQVDTLVAAWDKLGVE